MMSRIDIAHRCKSENSFVSGALVIYKITTEASTHIVIFTTYQRTWLVVDLFYHTLIYL